MASKFASFVAMLSALADTALAVPASTPVPEVIPGPGMPTLASLNLTSAELYAMGAPTALYARSANSAAQCQTYSTAVVDDVIACFNYLGKIGNDACVVSQDYVVFCIAGTAGIGGSDTNGGPGTGTQCWDVALAVQDIFTECNVDGWVGGTEMAFGNSHLNVSVDDVRWFA